MPGNCRLIRKVNIWAVASSEVRLQMLWGVLKAEQMLCTGGETQNCSILYDESYFPMAVVLPEV